MPLPPDKKVKKRFNKDGRKLLGFALDDFYFFDDDEIEDAIDRALIRFDGQIDWRKQVRIWLWSHQHLRIKICKVAEAMYGDAQSE
jgi:hypothetical protein